MFTAQNLPLNKYIRSAVIPSEMEQKRSKYTDLSLSGLGKASRVQLATVLRKSAGIVTPAMAAIA